MRVFLINHENYFYKMESNQESLFRSLKPVYLLVSEGVSRDTKVIGEYTSLNQHEVRKKTFGMRLKLLFGGGKTQEPNVMIEPQPKDKENGSITKQENFYLFDI